MSELRSGKAGIDYHSRTLWLNESTPTEEAAAFVGHVAAEYGQRAEERERGLLAVAERARALENELRQQAIGPAQH